MKNFEKFEKEIKEIVSANNFWENMKKISNGNATNTQNLFEWLYEDYKEPLLTDEERQYLKAAIIPFRDSDIYIIKWAKYIKINDKIGAIFMIDYDYGYKFDGLEKYKEYSLEELGL